MATTTHDDYINCSDYEANLGNKSPINAAFSIFQQGDDYFFSWNNGQHVVLRSEAYPDAEKRDRGINAILKNCDLPERYAVIEEGGKYFLVLYGGGNHMEHTGNRENHSEIGRSCPHNSRQELNALLQFKGSDFANKVVPIEGSSVSNAALTGAATAVTSVAAGAENIVDATVDKVKDIGGSVVGAVGTAAAGAAATAASLADKVPGVSSVTGAASDAADYAKGLAGNVGETVTSSSGVGGWLKWLLPLLLLGVIGWFIYNKSCNAGIAGNAAADASGSATGSSASNSSADAVAKPNLSIDSITGAVVYELGDTVDIKLADGSMINRVPRNGFENTLVEFIKNGKIDTVDKTKNWFTLHDVQFKSNSTEYLTPKAPAQIKNVAAILKAYPGLQLKIGGYTDFVGSNDINKPLSDRRAKQVAKDLIANGAKEEQIKEAVGYGSDFAECKDKNDKIGLARDRKTAAKVSKLP